MWCHLMWLLFKLVFTNVCVVGPERVLRLARMAGMTLQQAALAVEVLIALAASPSANATSCGRLTTRDVSATMLLAQWEGAMPTGDVRVFRATSLADSGLLAHPKFAGWLASLPDVTDMVTVARFETAIRTRVGECAPRGCDTACVRGLVVAREGRGASSCAWVTPRHLCTAHTRHHTPLAWQAN